MKLSASLKYSYIRLASTIVHGDADRILLLESTAARLLKLIKNSQLVVIPGGPHAINWTHADRVNPVVLDFLQRVNSSHRSTDRESRQIVSYADSGVLSAKLVLSEAMCCAALPDSKNYRLLNP